MVNRPWTTEEHYTLINCINVEKNKDIGIETAAKKLNRTVVSCRNRYYLIRRGLVKVPPISKKTSVEIPLDEILHVKSAITSMIEKESNLGVLLNIATYINQLKNEQLLIPQPNPLPHQRW